MKHLVFMVYSCEWSKFYHYHFGRWQHSAILWVGLCHNHYMFWKAIEILRCSKCIIYGVTLLLFRGVFVLLFTLSLPPGVLLYQRKHGDMSFICLMDKLLIPFIRCWTISYKFHKATWIIWFNDITLAGRILIPVVKHFIQCSAQSMGKSATSFPGWTE